MTDNTVIEVQQSDDTQVNSCMSSDLLFLIIFPKKEGAPNCPFDESV
jgi:hypothetical protein